MYRAIKKINWTSPLAIIIYLSFIKFIIHLLFSNQYGYFRDELYFIDASSHLDLGYVDFAPLFAWIARLHLIIFGDSLIAIRLLPALAGALKVFFTGLIIKELGGKKFAIFLGCLCIIIAPVFLGIDTLFTMNAFEPLFWLGCIYFLILAINKKEPRFLIGFWIIAGFGIMLKHTTVLFVFSILLGLLLTKERRLIKSKWFWIGLIISFLIVLPNIIWQVNHNFASLEDIKNVRATGKNVSVNPLEFIITQIFVLNPLTAFVWILGVWYFLIKEKQYRFISLGFFIIFALWTYLQGKFYYLVPVYPILFAGGAIIFEKLNNKYIKFVYVSLLIITGIIVAPLVIPILPVESFVAYQNFLHIGLPKTEVQHTGSLPQNFGDMFGWPEMVEKVSKVYYSLSEEERAKAAIFAENYGEAGAINLFGKGKGLPKAISGHQNYYLWGPLNYTGEIVIIVGYDKKDIKGCNSLEETEKVENKYSMPGEQYTILICRGLETPLKELWPTLKRWD